jgi:hypothetical protein
MEAKDILNDAVGRIRDLVRRTVDGMDADALAWRPDPEANSVAWLVWHLTRVQDDHVADLAGNGQVWDAGGWAERFGLPPGSTDTGYGHEAAQVAAIRPDGPDVLVAYHEAVADRTAEVVAGLGPEDLDRVVDRSWDPPVTAGVRLVSVVSDGLQHIGQAAYLRGLRERRERAG